MNTTNEVNYQPFSNGSEFDTWHSRNCAQCAKYEFDNEPTCPGDEGLTTAMLDDGTISEEVADFIGTTDRHTQDNDYGFCDLNHKCNQFEANS